MRLLLVRHGESTWNAVRRWQGQADPPLSPVGESQAFDACRVAARLARFDEVVTSTLQRARRTGELLSKGLGVTLGDAVTDLRERDAGEWEGLTRVEINDRYPGFLDADRRPPGYEPDADVVVRATAVLVAVAGRAAESGARRLLVVSHGGVINALERHADEARERLDNLEGRWFEVEPDRAVVRPIGERVHLLADDRPRGETERGYA